MSLNSKLAQDQRKIKSRSRWMKIEKALKTFANLKSCRDAAKTENRSRCAKMQESIEI